MIALPSIAFGGFSGSAKGVTARQVGGRSILSVRSWPTGQTTSAQVVRRASLSKITKSYKTLTDSQMKDWERLAEHTSGQSVFGQKAQLTGINLYVRLNANRVMAGEALIAEAPAAVAAVPNVSYSNVEITPQLVIFGGIMRELLEWKHRPEIIVPVFGLVIGLLSACFSSPVLAIPTTMAMMFQGYLYDYCRSVIPIIIGGFFYWLIIILFIGISLPGWFFFIAAVLFVPGAVIAIQTMEPYKPID